jgi:hypothetical protein
MVLALCRQTVPGPRCRVAGAAFLFSAAAACGGRASSPVVSIDAGARSGASAGSVGSSGGVAPSGSASGEVAPDAFALPTDSSLGEAPPSASRPEGGSNEGAGDDSPVMDASASGGGDVAVNEPLGACCGQPEPSCAPGVCCVATDCQASERCLHHVCQSVTCDPASGGIYYVDPSAGTDDAPSTGAVNCPFRSLTHVLSLLGADSGAAVTIKIVNDGFAPVLGARTGEVLPITPPANVTITAVDTTKNPPALVLPASQITPNGYNWVTGFLLTNPGDNLSYVVVEGSGVLRTSPTSGIAVLGHAGTIDHVTVQNTSGRGIDVEDGNNAHGLVTLGPGVVSRNNGETGVFLLGWSAVDIKGGRGVDHTSFTGNGSGISLRDVSSVVIEGTGIDPARPDESDVDTDNNVGAGLVIGVEGISQQAPNVVRGLHSSGNTNGIEVGPCAELTLRGSYLGHNSLSGVRVANTQSNFGGCIGNPGSAVGDVDLGNAVDYGRNVFQAPDAGGASKQGAALCMNVATPFGREPWPAIRAVGNLFGSTDCAVGGTLTRSETCDGPVDLGGISPPDAGPVIDVSSCR